MRIALVIKSFRHKLIFDILGVALLTATVNDGFAHFFGENGFETNFKRGF